MDNIELILIENGINLNEINRYIIIKLDGILSIVYVNNDEKRLICSGKEKVKYIENLMNLYIKKTDFNYKKIK